MLRLLLSVGIILAIAILSPVRQGGDRPAAHPATPAPVLLGEAGRAMGDAILREAISRDWDAARRVLTLPPARDAAARP